MARVDWPVLAAAAALAALTWGWWVMPHAAPADPAGPPIVRRAAMPAASAPEDLARPVLNPAAQRLQHGPDDVQLCGGAWVRRDAEHQVDLGDLVRAVRIDEVGDRLTAALRADHSPEAQGLALYFDVVEAGSRAEREQPRCEGEDCAARALPASLLNAVDALARFASTSGDPAVYGWALRVCGGSALRSASAACAALSVARWSQFDPDNAAPWLDLLAAASARHDAAAADEALHRIATARRYDAGRAAMSRTALDHLGSEDRDLAANQIVMIGVIGLQSAWSVPGYQSLSTLCGGDALRDPNRRQVCDGVAETLAQRSEDLMTQMIGVGMGERLGWPADRLDRLHGERQAFFAATLAQRAELDLGSGLVGSCTDLHRRLGHLRDVAQRGETGVMREWLAQSALGAQDHLQAGRRQREQRAAREAAYAAALRASAPSAVVADGAR